jgi:hypothetical protein
MESKITGGASSHLFNATILSKHTIGFFQCQETGFIQTEKPHWLSEAYADAITKLDLGLVQRNIELSETVAPILNKFFNPSAAFLDYAGGYGLFTRLMRNKGFNFYHTDKFCANIFAEGHDLSSENTKPPFELVTAFEVFEHLENPMADIEEILQHAPNLLFSTVIVPSPIPAANEWWYYSLETGQHIAFYTISSLEFIAKKHNKFFYSNGKNLHLFSVKELRSNPFKKTATDICIKLLNSVIKKLSGKRNSLLDADIQQAKQLLKNNS